MHANLQDSVMYSCEGSAPRPGRLLSGGSVDCLGQNSALGDDHHVAAAIGEGRGIGIMKQWDGEKEFSKPL